jgi:general L-amino acid transport system permease protein
MMNVAAVRVPGRMTALLRSGRFRGLVYQATLVVTACGVLITLVVNTRQNLVAQGIASGFDFLERSTGWNVSFALMDYSIRDPYWRVFLVGFENTIFVGLLSLVFATVIGTLIGIARVGRNPLLNLLGMVHVEIFRSVPLILQGLFWYAILTHLPPPRQSMVLWDSIYLSSRGIYFPFVAMSHRTFLAVVSTAFIAASAIHLAPRLPSVSSPKTRRSVVRGILIAAVAIGIAVIVGNHDPKVGLFTKPRLLGLRFEGGLRLTPEFSALFIAIVCFGSAYIAEIVRGGLLSVNKGHLEAARALGLRPFHVYWFVRMPLALRSVVPPLGNQFVWLMKATTVGIAFGFSDLFMVSSTAINQSGQTIEILFIMMAGFLLINYVIVSIMNALNRSIALKGFETKRG